MKKPPKSRTDIDGPKDMGSKLNDTEIFLGDFLTDAQMVVGLLEQRPHLIQVHGEVLVAILKKIEEILVQQLGDEVSGAKLSAQNGAVQLYQPE